MALLHRPYRIVRPHPLLSWYTPHLLLSWYEFRLSKENSQGRAPNPPQGSATPSRPSTGHRCRVPCRRRGRRPNRTRPTRSTRSFVPSHTKKESEWSMPRRGERETRGVCVPNRARARGDASSNAWYRASWRRSRSWGTATRSRRAWERGERMSACPPPLASVYPFPSSARTWRR